jgi:biopolymer transport protein ExbB
MPRAVLFVLALASCTFDHRVVAGDGGGSGAIDAPDATASGGAKVRMLDIDDARVIGGPHAAFPLLVSITAPWLRTTDKGGDVARMDGFDIWFSPDQAGVTKLPHEVELYSPDAGTLIAWVRMPMLAADSVVYLNYGNPALSADPQNVPAVWSSGFEAVFHLDAITDAAGKAAQIGSATSGTVAGAIDVAQLFDGADNNVDMGSATAVDDIFVDGGTAEAWFFAETFGEDVHGRIFDKGHTLGWSLWVNNNERASSLGFLHGTPNGGWGFWNTASNSITLNQWHHVALVYNQDSVANAPVFYVDGALATSATIDAPSTTMVSDAAQSLRAGNRAQLDRGFDGMLDELRLSSVARDAGWIATEFRNQQEPAAFFTIGPPL